MSSILRTVNLKKSYTIGRIETPVLRGIDLDIRTGEFVSIMGPSGCGKSTLLFVLGGMTRPTSGSVYIDGEDTTQWSDVQHTEMRRQRLGFVFPLFNLLPTLTAYDNIRIAQKIRGAAAPSLNGEIHEALAKVGLSEKLRHRPVELSIGEQQRLAIARAMINRPDILLADEPTGNLDSGNSEAVLDILKCVNASEGQTIVMVTHNSDAAAVADRIIKMKDGRIADES